MHLRFRPFWVFTAGVIFGSPTDYRFNSVVISSGKHVSEWVVGDSMIGEDSVGSPLDPEFAWVVSTLELKSISAVTDPAAEIARLLLMVNKMPAADFKNKNMRKTLVNKLEAVASLLVRGDDAAAAEKLQDDVLSKTDGCAGKGRPDGNDWLKACGAQDLLYPEVAHLVGLIRQLTD